jgi:hypothetical protein
LLEDERRGLVLEERQLELRIEGEAGTVDEASLKA